MPLQTLFRVVPPQGRSPEWVKDQPAHGAAWRGAARRGAPFSAGVSPRVLAIPSRRLPARCGGGDPSSHRRALPLDGEAPCLFLSAGTCARRSSSWAAFFARVARGAPLLHSSSGAAFFATRHLRWAALRELSLSPRGVTRARTGLCHEASAGATCCMLLSSTPQSAPWSRGNVGFSRGSRPHRMPP